MVLRKHTQCTIVKLSILRNFVDKNVNGILELPKCKARGLEINTSSVGKG